MSDNTPSNTLGGLISSLFRGKTNDDGTRGGLTGTHKALGGALLAAGAAYLYQRVKNKPTAISNQLAAYSLLARRAFLSFGAAGANKGEAKGIIPALA